MIAVLIAAVVALCVTLWTSPAPVIHIVQVQSGESVARKSDRLPIVKPKHHKRKPLLIVPSYYYRKN